jgi:hypothetical protein
VLVKHAQRGQALVETALFLPLMLLLLFAIIYLSQAGVAQERGQVAVRYGSLVSPAKNYSVEAMYQAYGAGLPSPTPYSSPTACPGTSASDTQAAVNQAQMLPSNAPTSFPTTQPFWRVPSPSAGCVMGERQVSQGAYPGLTVGFVEAMTNTVTATTIVPSYLSRAIPSAVALNAKMTVYLPLTVGDLLYCTVGLQGSIVGSGNSWGPWYGPQGSAIPNPIPVELDPAHTLFPAFTAMTPVAWGSNDNSFNYHSQVGVGSAPLGCENY